LTASTAQANERSSLY